MKNWLKRLIDPDLQLEDLPRPVRLITREYAEAHRTHEPVPPICGFVVARALEDTLKSHLQEQEIDGVLQDERFKACAGLCLIWAQYIYPALHGLNRLSRLDAACYLVLEEGLNEILPDDAKINPEAVRGILESGIVQAEDGTPIRASGSLGRLAREDAMRALNALLVDISAAVAMRHRESTPRVVEAQVTSEGEHAAVDQEVKETVQGSTRHEPVLEAAIGTPIAGEQWTEQLEDDRVYELRRDLRTAEYPFHEVTRRTPQRTLDLVIGLPDWVGELNERSRIVLGESETEWAMRLMEVIAEAMEGTWRRTGWLQGTQVVGPLLQQLEDQERTRQVRLLAETALLSLLPTNEEIGVVPYPLRYSLDSSFRDLEPLSDWVEHRRAKKMDHYDGLARSPRGTRGQVGSSPKTTGDELRPHTRRVRLEQALRDLERAYMCQATDMGLEHLPRIVTVMSDVGTDEAAIWLGGWLVGLAEKVTTGPYDSSRSNWIINYLTDWKADPRHLYRGLDVVLNPSAPWWVWHSYLRATMRLGRADAAAYLARLMAQEGQRWTHEQRKEVVGLLGGYGDQRVITRLAWWWDREWQKEDDGSGLRTWISEALWGMDGERGVLVRQSTKWLVDWLEEADVSDDFRAMAALRVLRPRYLVDGVKDERIARLGRRWLARGTQEANLALARAGAYLTDSASREELDALEELERGLPPEGRIHLAARMGMWEIVKLGLEEYIEKGLGYAWKMVELAAEQQYLPILPLLVDHYLNGKEWIGDAGLHKFHWQDIDECLDRRREERGARIDRRTAGRLWKLGTPGAITWVLNALREGADILTSSGRLDFDHIPKAHRESVWPVLEEFLNELEDEQIRWDIIGAIQFLWWEDDRWPWDVTRFFFDRLDDPDDVVVQQASALIKSRISGMWGPVWRGEAEAYQQGLQELAVRGTDLQRQFASWWLDKVVFEEPETSQDDDVESEAPLAPPEDVGRELLELVCRREGIAQEDWDIARERALDILVGERRYLWTLGQAVQRGEVPAWWLMAAVAAQEILLEETDGAFFVRRGQRRLPLEDWARM